MYIYSVCTYVYRYISIPPGGGRYILIFLPLAGGRLVGGRHVALFYIIILQGKSMVPE